MTKQLPKPGQRIECVIMLDDPAPIAPGSRGTVLRVQEVMGLDHIEVAWDSGRTLALLVPLDTYRILSAETV